MTQATAEVQHAPSAPGEDRRRRLRVDHVRKEFERHGGDVVYAVDDVSFDVHAGEILVLLGPSGCGKSTLLRCIAGLETPSSGRIEIDDVVVFDSSSGISQSPKERDVNMMFQSYALWPHMNLEDNVAYPLRAQGVKKSVARRRANEYLELVGLARLGKQYPGMISGGQQQRVALARTLISEPSVVLFDEPLSNVDARIRAKLRALLVDIHNKLHFAAVYVTHDQLEAMGLGTRIAVMRNGRIDQLDVPQRVYERPSNRSTAEFVGEANFFEGTVVGESGGYVKVRIANGEVDVPRSEWPSEAACRPGRSVTLMVRPELCELTTADPTGTDGAAWPATITSKTYAGAYTEYRCEAGTSSFTVWVPGPQRGLENADRLTLRIPTEAWRVVADD